MHINILRKMEVQFGLDHDSLDCLASYIGDWEQYVVVEAARSRQGRQLAELLKVGVCPQCCGEAPQMIYLKQDLSRTLAREMSYLPRVTTRMFRITRGVKH